MTDILTTSDRRLLQGVANNWKLTPATFAHRISKGSWIPGKWLLYVSARIARAIAKGNGRIIISAPPRHGKSQLCSIWTPSWLLEVMPHIQIILASYGAELSIGFGRQVRDIFADDDNKNLLKTRLRSDSRRVALWQTEQGGQMASVGLGGPITGRGADVLLIDDYIKEIKEALSQVYRDYIWNWFSTTAYTRLEPGGTCIIIATRWHSDDLIGRVLTEWPGKWEYIELPAIAERDDLIGRTPGQVLFPERYNLESILEKKEVLGTIFFNALYQQRPVDQNNKITDGRWLKLADELPMAKAGFRIKTARIWDLAATEDGGDYTVGSKCHYNTGDGKFYISNVKRDQLSPKDVEALVRQTAIDDGVDVEIGIEQEPGSAGKSLVNHYAVTVLPEFTVVPIPVAGTNKVLRAQPLLAAAEAGKTYLMVGPWNDSFAKEFDSFPIGLNDDQVDTAAAGYTYLSGKKNFTASWGRKQVSDKRNSMQTRIEGSRLASAGMKVRGASFGRGTGEARVAKGPTRGGLRSDQR